MTEAKNQLWDSLDNLRWRHVQKFHLNPHVFPARFLPGLDKWGNIHCQCEKCDEHYSKRHSPPHIGRTLYCGCTGCIEHRLYAVGLNKGKDLDPITGKPWDHSLPVGDCKCSVCITY